MKWVKKEQNSHFKSINTRARRSDTTWHAPETSACHNAHARSYQEDKHSLNLSADGREERWQAFAECAHACHSWPLPHADNRTQQVKCVFKKPGIIMMWQRFLISCSCYRRSLTRSYLKLPSLCVIGERQSTAEDNNLPSITILTTLVWLHKLSLSCINQELNPRDFRINQQTLATSLHFSGNEDSFRIISHSA